MGFEATTHEAPQNLKGLAKSYLLFKDQDVEVKKFKGEDFTIVGRRIQYW